MSVLHVINIKNCVTFIESKQSELQKTVSKYLLKESDEEEKKEILDWLKKKGYEGFN